MVTVADRCAQGSSAHLFICDFSPPRGGDPKLLEPAKELDVDFVSVAYNPGRSARVNSAFAAYWIHRNTGKQVVFTLATRDMNKLAVQSLLLGADLLGLQNVVVVKGDDFTERDLAVVKGVGDYRPTELIGSINAMNEGKDFKGLKLRTPTDFCVGASIDLGRGISPEVSLTRRKVEAGTSFFLLQAVFDPQLVRQLLDGYAERYEEELSVPLFCGIQVMAPEGIVLGDVPSWVTEDMDAGRSGRDIAVQMLHDFADQGFNRIYLVPPILRGGRRDYEAAQAVLEEFRR